MAPKCPALSEISLYVYTLTVQGNIIIVFPFKSSAGNQSHTYSVVCDQKNPGVSQGVYHWGYTVHTHYYIAVHNCRATHVGQFGG